MTRVLACIIDAVVVILEEDVLTVDNNDVFASGLPVDFLMALVEQE